MPTQICRCGCGKAATITLCGYPFAERRCKDRFYRETIALARLGDAAAAAIVHAQGWKINARIGTVRTPLGVVTNRGLNAAAAAAAAAPPPVSKPAPAAAAPAPTQSASAPKAPRVKKSPRVLKQFALFLDSRCKNLKLAAKVLDITPRPPLLKTAVRAAWIAQISKHHPDRGGALEAAQAINAAYQLLQKFSY